MNNEFLSRYRTAIVMFLTILITFAILYISWKNGDIQYLDRGLYFFSGMMMFVLFRNLIHSIKIDNKQFGVQIEGKQPEDEKEKEGEKK